MPVAVDLECGIFPLPWRGYHVIGAAGVLQGIELSVKSRLLGREDM